MSSELPRLAFFSPNLAGGGAERVISILSSAFSARGFSVDLVLLRAEGSYLSSVPSFVNVVDLGEGRVLTSIPKLIRYLKNVRPAVIFTSQMHTSLAVLWAARLASVGTEVIIRQPTMLAPKYARQTRYAKSLKALLLWSAKRWADHVVVSSEYMASELLSLSDIPSSKISIIPNPLAIKNIENKSQQSLNHPWFSVDKKPVILAVGRLIEVKDFHSLIVAYSLVIKEIDARLMILGEGPLKPQLERLIEKLGISQSVLLPGFSDNPFYYMRNASIFVSSSLWEGFPNGLIEAMACGTPIVATNCDGGTAEILEHGKWGELVEPKSPDKLAGAIIKVLKCANRPDVRARAEDFDITKVIKRYEEIFFKNDVL